MGKNSKLAIFVACFGITGFSANAEYNIKDAIEDAKLNNQELQYIEQSLSVKKLDKYRAASGFWPIVNAEISQSKGEGAKPIRAPYSDVSTNNRGLAVQQELFAGGKTVANIKIAGNNVNAAEFEFKSKTSDIFLKIIDAYHEVILARRVYKISINSENAMKNKLDQVQTRFKAGEITKTDVSWAKYSLAKAVTEKEKALGDMKTAEANFSYVIGRAPDNDLVYVQANKIALPKDLETFAAIVRKANLNIKNAKEQLSASKLSISAASADLMPRVTADINFAHREVNSDDLMGEKGRTYSLKMSVPIFNGSTYINIKEAKYKARGAEASLNNLIGSIEQNIVDIWNQNQVAVSQITSVKEAIIAAKDALDGVQQEYKSGTKTTLDLFESEQRLFNAQVEQERVNKSLVISAFKMKALMGELHQFNFEVL